MKTLFNEIKALWENQFMLSTPRGINTNKGFSEEDYADVEAARCKNNVRKIILLAFILLIIEIINTAFLLNYSTIHSAFRMAYLAASGFLSTLCILYLIIIARGVAKSENPKTCKTTYRSFWTFYISGTLIFCLLELTEGMAFTNFVLMMMVIAVIPIFSIREMLAYGGAGLTAEIVFLYFNDRLSPDNIQLAVMIFAVACIVSHIMHTSFFNVNIAHRQLEKMAETDPLTSLLNRRGFEKRLEHTWKHSVRNSSRVMVAMIDIDFFKSLNEKFGHAAGDVYLREVAESISADFKRGTDIAARFGGEEFILFAAGLSDEKIIEFMKKITARVEALRIYAADTSVSEYVTVSIGAVSAQAEPGLTFDRLYQTADRELSKAKLGGKNALSFNGAIYRSEAGASV